MLRRKNAFTLIELLVVVSIIALLVSILMPALAAAREQGQRAVCLSQVRGMTTAWLLYADDSDDKLVRGTTRPVSPIGAGLDFQWTPDAGLDAAMGGSHTCYNGSHADWIQYFAPEKTTWTGYYPVANPNSPTALEIMGRKACVTLGSLYPYIEDPQFYKCPTVNVEVATSTYSIIDLMNGHTCFHANRGAVILKQLSEIKSPAERVVFNCEGPEAQKGALSWTPLNLVANSYNLYGGPWPGPWDQVSIWHNKGTTFSFADGHAEYHQWTHPRTIGYADGSISWPWGTPSTPDNDDTAWLAQYGYGVVLQLP